MLLKILAVIVAWCLEVYFLLTESIVPTHASGAKEMGCGTY
jgi:hypothetical protein